MATIKNLVLEQGATFSANIQYLNSNKVPISLVGYNVRSKMRTSYNAANAAAFVAVITNEATGNINLSLTASETAALEYGRYVYDVEAYSGQVLVRVVEGTIDVTPGVSGMDLGSLLSGNVSTTDLIEGNNLYYTNARVQSALLNISGNILPSVSNTYNLGSPTQRWKSLFLEDKTIFLGNVAISLDDLTNKLTFIDTSNAAATISLQIGTGANSVTLDAQNGSLSTLLSPNSITSVMIAPGAITSDKIGGFNTANVAEFTNLYFTNARAIGSFTAGSNISISPTGEISASGQITGTNLTGYATTSNLDLKANISDLLTDKVTETTSLYFTNTRARAAFTAGPNITIDANGIISSSGGGAGGGTGTVTQANLTTSNVIEHGNNLYYTNVRVYSNVINILSSYSTVSNLNLKANLTQLTTANVVEAGNILYYTNARVRSAFIAGANITIDANGVISSTGGGGGGSGTVTQANLTTSNVVELNNLYYTNARVYSNVINILTEYATVANLNLRANIADLTTANVAETSNNLYYTNARVYANVIGLFADYATVANLNLKANVVDLTTANVTEVNNLYYTNARVASNVIALLPTLAGSGIAIAANGQISSTATIAVGSITNDKIAASAVSNDKISANAISADKIQPLSFLTVSGNVGASNVNVGTGVGGAIIGANLISANNFVAETITANTFTLSYRPAFRVYGTAYTNIVSGTTLDSGNVVLDYNQNSCYNTSTGIFTAPITGLYHIYLNVRAGATNGLSEIAVLKNNQNSAGNVLCFWEIITNNSSATHFGVTTVARLTANDNVRAKVIAGSITFDSNDNWGVAFIG